MEVRLGVEPSIKRFADAALATRDADLMDPSLEKHKLEDLRYPALESNQVYSAYKTDAAIRLA